ncbi:MAG: hypothetical protein GWO81_00295 [Verrucomicrobia bacterium]|nr:hypothetical protein [Verrucomicrobiota bacterium]
MSLEKLITIVSESLETLPEESLSGGTVFKDLKAWDSLAVLTLVDAVDMEFGVLLKKDDFLECVTLAALYERVQAIRRARGN